MMMIEQDIFKCSACGYEMDENYIGCPKCKAFGTIKFLKRVEIGPCECADCVATAERKEKHLNSPFYKIVKEKVEHFALQQILKGAETYPEPFNPDSWTEEQLYEHAMQELADAQNYSTGMLDRMVKQRQEIERLNKENENQLHYINSARKDYTQALETINELRKEIRQVNEDSMKIESVSDFNADECQRLREENAALEEKYKAKFEEYETLFEISGRQNKNTVLDKREIERLAKKTVELENKISDLESENRTLKGEF